MVSYFQYSSPLIVYFYPCNNFYAFVAANCLFLEERRNTNNLTAMFHSQSQLMIVKRVDYFHFNDIWLKHCHCQQFLRPTEKVVRLIVIIYPPFLFSTIKFKGIFITKSIIIILFQIWWALLILFSFFNNLHICFLLLLNETK